MRSRSISRSVVLTILVVTAACGRQTPEDLSAAADSAIAAGEFRTAEIHLKNLLQLQPDDAAARLRLGEVELASGDFAGAEQTLRRALAQGADGSAVELPLLRALLSQGKFAAVFESVSASTLLDDPRYRAELLEMQGAALRGSGDHAGAERAFRSALEAAPASVGIRTDLARVLLELNRVDESLHIVSEVLDDEPAFAPALLLRGEIEVRSGLRSAAETTFKRVLETEPKSGRASPSFAMATARLIEVQLALGKTADAAANADVLVARMPGDPTARYLKAVVAFETEKLDEAESLLERLLAENPRHEAANRLLGTIKFRRGLFGQAEMYLQSALAGNQADDRARMLLAETYVRRGDIDSARRLLRDATRPVAESVFLAYVGRASREAGLEEQAVDYFERSERNALTDASQLADLTGMYIASGELDRATRVLRASPLEGSANEPLRTYLLAVTQVRQGDLAGAARTTELLQQQLPSAAWPLVLRGSIASLAGDRDAAIGYLEMALEREPGNMAALLGSARFASESGDFEQAHEYLDRAPRSPTALWARGELLANEGEHDLATAVFEELFALQPSEDAALRIYENATRAGRREPERQLREWSADNPRDVRSNAVLGSIALDGGALDEATQRFEAVVAAEPSHAGALNNLAWLYTEKGDARAIEVGERALQSDPENPSIADTVGWALLKFGDKQRARRLLEQAVQGLPQQAEVRYHWAVALAETGDAQQARSIFGALVAENADFRGRADAMQRLAALAP